ncbi:MAG: SCE4755 family polysaccharide monooxygenase-like protein [Nannocystaceae bacterium]
MLAVSTLGLASLLAGDARAHFRLEAPAANQEQNDLGDPQKFAPCGDDGTAVPTGDVTNLVEGGMLTITIDETVPHPGHYRVAIAQTPDELPPEPDVTAGATACGSVQIMDPAVMPVLADGLFVHETPFAEPQTIDIPLPEGFTCDNCTLQVLEFMSSHGAPCFYHHCATVTIQPAGATDSGGGSSDGGSASATTDASGSSGGGGDSAGDRGSASASASASAGESSGSGGGSASATAGESSGSDTAAGGDDDGGGCSCTTFRSAPVGSVLGLFALVLVTRRRR